MERRYQVFVSSTFTDLVEERQSIMQALLELDCIPAGMELFSASDEDQWSLIKGVIDSCDYYVVLIGGRYGSMTAEGISFTEKEFDYAVSVEKPVLAFLHKKPEEIPAGKTEMDPDARSKLSEFRAKAESDRVCKYWTSSEELGTKVTLGLVKVFKAKQAEGWVKARYAASPEFLNQISELNAENQRLKATLAAVGNKIPEGTEDYAGGEDAIGIRCNFELSEDKTTVECEISLSWDEVFSIVGPIMYEDCSESKMRAHFSSILQQYYDERPSNEYGSFKIYEEDFQTIKIQLYALGLIMVSEKYDVPGTGNANWILTPYGQGYITKLRAIRKNSSENKLDELKEKAILK